MALRLAGEPFLDIQGADDQGWVREVTAQDSLPGLKIDQQGTGHVFDFQDGGVNRMFMNDGGNVLLANADSPPSTPDTLLHLWGGSAGTVSASADAKLTIEDDAIVVLQMLAPKAEQCGINFGFDDDNDYGAITFPGSSNGNGGQMRTRIAGSLRLIHSAGAFAFQEPTAVETTSGDLTLDPAGKIALGAGKLISGWSTQTTVGAAGGASAPPANPTGYAKIDVGGTAYVIPYYAAA